MGVFSFEGGHKVQDEELVLLRAKASELFDLLAAKNFRSTIPGASMLSAIAGLCLDVACERYPDEGSNLFDGLADGAGRMMAQKLAPEDQRGAGLSFCAAFAVGQASMQKHLADERQGG